MDLTLKRRDFLEDGIFGDLYDEKGNWIAATLEHSYGLLPKVAAGKYKCVRHPPVRLSYETFMLENVPPFQGKPVSGILIHCGNFETDSAGCILIGQSQVDSNGVEMITNSRIKFKKFMKLQENVNEFTLTII